MKKIGVIFLMCVLVLVGCGGGSKDEGLALDYINTFLNGTDKESQNKFFEEKVHPDVAALFALGHNKIRDEKNMFKDPKIVKSVEYEEAGTKGTLVLTQGTVDGQEQELIVLVMDGKIAFSFNSDGKSDTSKKAFEEMRAKFK